MKKRNTIVAVMMAAAMTMSLGMGTVSFAAGDYSHIQTGTVTGNQAEETDRGSITVNGVATGTITAYQVAKGIYEGGYFKGYRSLVPKVDVDDLDAASLTADIVAEIAESQTSTYPAYTDLRSLPVGVYVIIVSGTSDARVYSPMMGSVYYNPDDHGATIIGTTINAKYTDGGVTDKEITSVGEVTVNGKVTDKITVGSIVSFKVTGTVPNYDLNMYEDIEYTLTDSPSAGLEFVDGSAVVTVAGIENPIQASFADDGTLTFALDEKNIKPYLGKTIVITYNAIVTMDAITEETNTFNNRIDLTYTNSPGETSTADPKETYMYTYDINDQLAKVDEKGTSLAGATFTLYTDETCKTPFNYANSNEPLTSTTTAEDNHIDFFNLPANTYYIKETTAPEGYQLTGKVFRVVIAPIPNDKGEPTAEANITITDLSTETATNEVINTRLSALPSTGGMGTYLFTIGGVVIMAGAAGLLIAKRRRDA